MNAETAEIFAAHWIEAWNSHDLDRILSHYDDDFEMSSPVIVQAEGVSSGTLKGKDKIAGYWARALQRSPELHFEKLHVLSGANSVTIVYSGVRGLSAEVFLFSETGNVCAAYAHYAPAITQHITSSGNGVS